MPDPRFFEDLGPVTLAERASLTGAELSDADQGQRQVRGVAVLASAQADTVTRYQIRLSVTDRSGVLHRITEVFSTHDVSIETMIQAPREDRAGSAYLILTTHAGRERALAATVAALEALEVVQEVTSVLRVEGF